MECVVNAVKIIAVVLLCLVIIQAGFVSATPLPSEENDREGKGFLGFTFFAPPKRVEPHECVATNGVLTVGTCYNKQSCTEMGGVDSGTCPTGGVCCVIPTVCGGTVARNRTWFVNKDFPDKSRNFGDCVITIKKEIPRVKQVRLDFTSLQLAGPRRGRCLDDVFEVAAMKQVQGREERVEIAPKLCGDNSGQHVYVNMENGDAKVHVKLGGTLSTNREWRILISQLDEVNAAPKDCLQYHREPTREVRSLNYESDREFKDDLNYDICFPKLLRSNQESCKRKVSNVDIQQSPSFRSQDTRRRKMKRNKHRRMDRSAESRELPMYSSPEQSLQDKKMMDAITNVLGQIAGTNEAMRMGLSPNRETNPFDEEDINQSGRNTDNKEEVETSIEDSDNVFPMLYSLGNEGVISQIQQVVLQLQQEQLLTGGAGYGGFGLNADNDSTTSITPTPTLDETTLLPNTDEAATNSVTMSFPDSTPGNDEGSTNHQVVTQNLQMQSIDDSVNSVSNIINEILTSQVTLTTVPPYYVTDNMAVEGTMVEMTVLPEEPMEASKTTESSDIEMTPENVLENFSDPLASIDDKKEQNSMMTMMINNGTAADDSQNIKVNAYLETTNLEKDAIHHDITTETYSEMDGILSTMSTPQPESNNDLDLTGSLSESKPENAQVELTVLDPESVRVHGDLVIIDTLSNEDAIDEDTITADVTTKSPTTVANTTLDSIATSTKITSDGQTIATTVMVVKTNETQVEDERPTEEDNTATKISSPLPQEDAPSVLINIDENAEKNEAGDDIQWLILEEGNPVAENSEPEFALPPEVVVSSDLGFGFSDLSENESQAPSVNNDKAEELESAANVEMTEAKPDLSSDKHQGEMELMPDLSSSNPEKNLNNQETETAMEESLPEIVPSLEGGDSFGTDMEMTANKNDQNEKTKEENLVIADKPIENQAGISDIVAGNKDDMLKDTMPENMAETNINSMSEGEVDIGEIEENMSEIDANEMPETGESSMSDNDIPSNPETEMNNVSDPAESITSDDMSETVVNIKPEIEESSMLENMSETEESSMSDTGMIGMSEAQDIKLDSLVEASMDEVNIISDTENKNNAITEDDKLSSSNTFGNTLGDLEKAGEIEGEGDVSLSNTVAELMENLVQDHSEKIKPSIQDAVLGDLEVTNPQTPGTQDVALGASGNTRPQVPAINEDVLVLSGETDPEVSVIQGAALAEPGEDKLQVPAVQDTPLAVSDNTRPQLPSIKDDVLVVSGETDPEELVIQGATLAESGGGKPQVPALQDTALSGSVNTRPQLSSIKDDVLVVSEEADPELSAIQGATLAESEESKPQVPAAQDATLVTSGNTKPQLPPVKDTVLAVSEETDPEVLVIQDAALGESGESKPQVPAIQDTQLAVSGNTKPQLQPVKDTVLAVSGETNPQALPIEGVSLAGFGGTKPQVTTVQDATLAVSGNTRPQLLPVKDTVLVASEDTKPQLLPVKDAALVVSGVTEPQVLSIQDDALAVSGDTKPQAPPVKDDALAISEEIKPQVLLIPNDTLAISEETKPQIPSEEDDTLAASGEVESQKNPVSEEGQPQAPSIQTAVLTAAEKPESQLPQIQDTVVTESEDPKPQSLQVQDSVLAISTNDDDEEADQVDITINIQDAILAISTNDKEKDKVDITINALSPPEPATETEVEDETVNEVSSDLGDTGILPVLTFPSDEEQCGGSFLKVRENIICGGLLRSEPFEDEEEEELYDDRFDDIDRISVRTMEGAERSLRFQLKYETDCPEIKTETTTTAKPVRKTVTLLQYLLGWY